MNIVYKNLFNSAYAGVPGVVHQVDPVNCARGVVVTGEGSGAWTATVLIEVSMDRVKWATRMSFDISSGSPTNCDSDLKQVFPFVRANVLVSTGTITNLYASMCASEV